MMYRPRRSVLYMPGSNARALEKAKSLNADCIILDLEDAVAIDAKEIARKQVCDALAQGGFGKREVIIRINALSTPWGAEDLKQACAAKPDAILAPKISSPEQVIALEQTLNDLGAQQTIKLWAMMETPLAVLQAQAIALCTQTTRLSCFVIGTNDLAKDTRAKLIKGRATMTPWLMTFLAAARSYGLDIIDGVYNNLQDQDGFAQECHEASNMGFDGKTLIHPNQIEICNQAFSPSNEEVAFAKQIVSAFALPENQSKGAIQLEGKMVERLHADMAQRLVAISEIL
jgi:citrate lyase subunit beta / citryl-CoA lyase